MPIKFHAVSEELIPKRATKGSAGYDFFAPEDIVIPPHGLSSIVDSGVSIELPERKVLMLYVRSSLGIKYKTTLINNVGIIDQDYYPNTIKCRLRNDGDTELTILKVVNICMVLFNHLK